MPKPNKDAIVINIKQCDVGQCPNAAQDRPTCNLRGYKRYRLLKMKDTRSEKFKTEIIMFYKRWIISQSMVDLGFIIQKVPLEDLLGISIEKFAEYVLNKCKKHMHRYNFGWMGWVIDFKRLPRDLLEKNILSTDIFHHTNMVPRWYRPKNKTTFPDGLYNPLQEPYRYLCDKHSKSIDRGYTVRLIKILKKRGCKDIDKFIQDLDPMMFPQTLDTDWRINIDTWKGEWIINIKK